MRCIEFLILRGLNCDNHSLSLKLVTSIKLNSCSWTKYSCWSNYFYCILLCRYLESVLSRQNSAHMISEISESLHAVEKWVWIFEIAAWICWKLLLHHPVGDTQMGRRLVKQWNNNSVFGGCNSILENEVLLHLIVIIIFLHAGEEIQFPYG
jgi:hypothetical protein